MNRMQLALLEVLARVLEGRVTPQQAAAHLELSRRQIERLVRELRRGSAAGPFSGKREPPHVRAARAPWATHFTCAARRRTARALGPRTNPRGARRAAAGGSAASA
jgi:hypothetical protein